MPAKPCAVSFRFTAAAKTLLEQIAAGEGIGQTDLLELLIRERARQLNIPIPPPTEEGESTT